MKKVEKLTATKADKYYFCQVMVRLVALLISILLQLIAAIFALRLMRVTKYRASWVLISLGFLLMAISRTIKLIQFLDDDFSFYLTLAEDWLGVLISFLFMSGVFLIGEIFFFLKRADIERNRSEKRLLNAIIQAEEKERRRFAKDLHDGLGPLLSSVKMSMSALKVSHHDPGSVTILENTTMMVNEAIGTIKEISNNLSPHTLTNFGLESAITNFVNRINQTKAISIAVTGNLGKERLKSNIETILYRAVCELINNTLKHAQAKTINISILKQHKTLTLLYQDDGIGFDPQVKRAETESGMGLSNITSRVKSINGIFILNSTASEGVNALIKVKLD